jgi:hypothetical protein
MEEAVRTPFGSEWDTYDIDVKSVIVDNLVAIARELLTVSFSRSIFAKKTSRSKITNTVMDLGMEISTSHRTVSLTVNH